MARLALWMVRPLLLMALGALWAQGSDPTALGIALPGEHADRARGVSERPAALFHLGAPALSPPASSLVSLSPSNGADLAAAQMAQPSSILISSFEGITRTVVASVTPDIAGEIGPDYFVQVSAGATFAVFDRAGTLLGGPGLIRDLWPPGSCHAANGSHASVVWDPETGRWFISYAGEANVICIAVSATSDPRGAYHLYNFYAGVSAESVDLGIWPEAVLISIPHPQSWIFALEKAKMVNGEGARAVGGYGPESGAGHPIPVSFSGGSLPFAGAYPLFLSRISPRVDLPSGRFILSRIKVGDWLPGHGSIGEIWSAPGSEVGAEADLSCGAPGAGCIAQPGTPTQLWASDPPIRAIARYRRFDAVQRIVAAVSVPMGAPARPQVNWFELDSEWPQQTWTPGGHGSSSAGPEGRWLGAAALNSAAEIGLAYSTSSAVITPSLQYAVWPRTAISGAASSESVFWPGVGANSADGAWNDRASLSVDPANGCAFWMTGVYLDATGAGAWRSRIGSFQTPDCGPVTYALRLQPDKADVCVDTPLGLSARAITMSATSLISLSAAVISPSVGLSAAFAVPPVSLAAPFSLPFTVTYPGSGPSGPTLLGLRASGSGVFTATSEVTVWKPVAAAPTLVSAVVNRAPVGQYPASPGITQTRLITYDLTFEWSAAPNAFSYQMEIASDAGFSSPVLSRTTQATLEHVRAGLSPLTNYFWRVRADNVCNSAESASGMFRTPTFLWLPIVRR